MALNVIINIQFFVNNRIIQLLVANRLLINYLSIYRNHCEMIAVSRQPYMYNCYVFTMIYGISLLLDMSIGLLLT